MTSIFSLLPNLIRFFEKTILCGKHALGQWGIFAHIVWIMVGYRYVTQKGFQKAWFIGWRNWFPHESWVPWTLQVFPPCQFLKDIHNTHLRYSIWHKLVFVLHSSTQRAIGFADRWRITVQWSFLQSDWAKYMNWSLDKLDNSWWPRFISFRAVFTCFPRLRAWMRSQHDPHVGQRHLLASLLTVSAAEPGFWNKIVLSGSL